MSRKVYDRTPFDEGGPEDHAATVLEIFFERKMTRISETKTQAISKLENVKKSPSNEEGPHPAHAGGELLLAVVPQVRDEGGHTCAPSEAAAPMMTKNLNTGSAPHARGAVWRLQKISPSAGCLSAVVPQVRDEGGLPAHPKGMAG